MKRLKVVVAPDSFKGSLTAMEICNAVEMGMKKIFDDIELTKIPMADGGEGTITSLVDATKGRIINCIVSGPLGGRTEAYFGILGNEKTAVIEMATASGLTLITREKRNPLLATTYGTGELIRLALDAGCRKIIIGIGGSATNDAGAGMAEALGVKFLDAMGRTLQRGGGSLINLDSIDVSNMDRRIIDTEIIVACDVKNPLTGENGASYVYGPQKGANSETVGKLDAALTRFAEVVKKELGKEVNEVEGAGAAGGLGAGLLAFTNAKLMPGVDIVVDAVDLKNKLSGADMVITGEGRTDFQTLYGKTVMGVANCAKSMGVPVIVLSGGYTEDAKGLYDYGIDVLSTIVKGPCSIEEAIRQSRKHIIDSAEGIARMLKIGIGIGQKE